MAGLFADLDLDGNGQVEYEDFLGWYLDIADAAAERRAELHSVFRGRKCATRFDPTPVSTAAVDVAISAAAHAPRMGQGFLPWKFRVLGPTSLSSVMAAAVGQHR